MHKEEWNYTYLETAFIPRANFSPLSLAAQWRESVTSHPPGSRHAWMDGQFACIYSRDQNDVISCTSISAVHINLYPVVAHPNNGGALYMARHSQLELQPRSPVYMFPNSRCVHTRPCRLSPIPSCFLFLCNTPHPPTPNQTLTPSTPATQHYASAPNSGNNHNPADPASSS